MCELHGGYALPNEFLARMKASLGNGFGEFLKSYGRAPERAVRVNSLKISPAEFEAVAPFALEKVAWEECGYYIAEEKPGKFLEHYAGLYYVQEPSAMCAAPLFQRLAGERVLDLCSAPGGKGTQLAQKMANEGILFLNEINFRRAKILSSNVERMGVENAVVTCATPEKLAEQYAGYFTKILVDAPCSGEGMFKKEEAAIPNWSTENVRLCAARQREILSCADRLLADGGELVYSTCTFAPEEDEGQAETFLQEHKNYTLLSMKKLLPHEVRGEGHFAAHFIKSGGEQANVALLPTGLKDKKLASLYGRFASETLGRTFGRFYLSGNHLYSVPADCPAFKVQTLRAGVHLGTFENGRFTPSHSLAMCLKGGEAGFEEMDEQTAYSFLGGNPFPCSQEVAGWRVASYRGYPLGWCKCVSGTAKNHFPKGLRNQ